MKYLLLALCLFGFQSTKAQRLGILGGLNISKATNSDGDYAKPLQAFYFGIVAEFPMTKKFFFTSGLSYSVKGYKITPGIAVTPDLPSYGSDFGTFVEPESVRQSTGYLEIPANLTYKLGLSNKMNLCFHAGPTFGLGLYRKIIWSRSTYNNFKTFDLYPKERFDFGMNVGSAIEFKNLSLGINYIEGLKDISNTTYYQMKNHVFQISATYYLKNKGKG
ncbi:MAG: porin family protein [Mariniphaga sp.]